MSFAYQWKSITRGEVEVLDGLLEMDLSKEKECKFVDIDQWRKILELVVVYIYIYI